MRDQHRTHLISTYTTALQHLAELRQVAASGKTPAGGRVAPVPEPMGERLFGCLDAVEKGLGELVGALAPEWNRDEPASAGPSAALMWVNVLLRTVEELVEDLHPRRMSRQYGQLGAGEAARLQSGVEEVLAALREAMSAVDGRTECDGA